MDATTETTTGETEMPAPKKIHHSTIRARRAAARKMLENLEFPNMENALDNFIDLSREAPSETAKEFWAGIRDATEDAMIARRRNS